MIGSQYEERALQAAQAAILVGHEDPENLRELLICTTSKATGDIVEQYFSKHYQDERLLQALIEIALEGEDAGDAPWAAANFIAEFPADLLAKHQASLQELSEHPWIYLHEPAKKALFKVISRGA